MPKIDIVKNVKLRMDNGQMDKLDLADKQKLKRLFLARNKISFPGAICHITQRATGREPLFLEEGDYLYMLHLLKEKAEKFNFTVFCYSLMPNHLHLLIRLSGDNLSMAMKQLYGEYATGFNKKYQRKGHVFGAPFRQALCFDESYFLAASTYIHLNPVRANLIEDPGKYRWSSCKLYVEDFSKKTFVDYKFILRILSNDPSVAQKIYKEMLSKAVRIKVQEIWEDPMGLVSFRNKLMRFLLRVVKGKSKNFLDEQELEGAIAELKMKGRLRSPQTLEARKFLIEQLQARGYTVKMVAEKLTISRQSIYHTLKKPQLNKIDIVKNVKLESIKGKKGG
ncbi:transposase [bacterium]|nr:transposase [bacterium]MBU1614337.1 transposase [bacterium]